MSTKVPNNSPTTPNKLAHQLDQLNHVPADFIFQQQAVWNKLETSLQNKRSVRFFPIWLRYAAAILLISLIGSWLLFSNSSNTKVMVKTNTTIIPKKSFVSQDKQQTSQPSLETSKQIKHLSIKPAPQLSKAAYTKSSSSTTQFSTTALTTTSPHLSSEASTQTSVQSSAQLITPTNTTTIAAPDKNTTAIAQNKKTVPKQLPVIHINEIGMGEQPNYSITNNKHTAVIEKEEPITITENTKTWWWPKPKPVTAPITTLTDNQ